KQGQPDFTGWCGDGIVTVSHAEECDPPGGSCSGDASCLDDCRCSLATVPNVVGHRLPQAESEIGGAGFAVGDEEASFDSSKPPGMVTSENPAGGGQVELGTLIDLGFTLPQTDRVDPFLTPPGQLVDDDISALAYYEAIGAEDTLTLDQ